MDLVTQNTKLKEKVYSVLESEFADSVKYSILLVLFNYVVVLSRNLEQIQADLIKLGIPKNPDCAEIIVRSTLRNLIKEGLAEEYIEGTDESTRKINYQLTAGGRKVASHINGMVLEKIAAMLHKENI